MQGSLWMQQLDSGTAVQLTSGPGYDYQPDVAPDGNRVVFVRYAADALELNVLDLTTGAVQQVTSGGAVNCEPRWSPDGKRIAWVSTAGAGHFHVFVGTLNGGRLEGGAAWPERKSTVARYYYSSYDHELSPSWSPDSNEIAYVGNPEIIYGTGPYGDAAWLETLSHIWYGRRRPRGALARTGHRTANGLSMPLTRGGTAIRFGARLRREMVIPGAHLWRGRGDRSALVGGWPANRLPEQPHGR